MKVSHCLANLPVTVLPQQVLGFVPSPFCKTRIHRSLQIKDDR